MVASKNTRMIAILTGSRADWGLLEPLVAELRKKYQTTIIVTGSHLSKQFGETWRDIPREWWGECLLSPCVVDWDNSYGVTQSMGLSLINSPAILANIKPDLLVVLGDRYETLSYSIGAYNLGVPIAHIQDSDVTLGSLDNGYRACIKALSTLRFPVDEYGSLGCVFPPHLVNCDYSYICIYHPYKGTWKKDLEEIVNVFKDKNTLFIGSNADAGGCNINKFYDDYGIKYIKSIPRADYIECLRGSVAIVGNSSSGIIEAPSLYIPTINIGDRQKGRLKAKSVIDCEPNQRAIESALEKIKDIKPEYYENPYFKEKTVERIVSELDGYLA